jgi:hypothetical protein
MPIRASDIQQSKKEFLLKEIDIIQKVLDKIDGWIVQIRIGIVTGLAACVTFRFTQHVNISPWALISLVAVSWIGEAFLRVLYQDGYLKRRQGIECFLEGRLTELNLFDPKGDHMPGIDRGICGTIRRRVFNLNTIVFHIIIVVLGVYFLWGFSDSPLSDTTHFPQGAAMGGSTIMSGTQLPPWAEWARAIGPALVSALAVLVSIVSVCLSRQIARWQASVAKETVRQSYYDRRFAIFIAFRELLVAIVDKADVDIELRHANAARAASPFLLNEQLGRYLEELHKEGFRLNAMNKLLASDAGYKASLTPQQLGEEATKLASDKLIFTNRVPELAERFEPFLKPEELHHL